MQDLVDKINHMEIFEVIDGETNEKVSIKLKAKFTFEHKEGFFDRLFTVTDESTGSIVISRGQRISEKEVEKIGNPAWVDIDFFQKCMDTIFGSLFSEALFKRKYKWGSREVSAHYKSLPENNEG